MIEIEGMHINRILAGPGQTVRCLQGSLSVNGLAPESPPPETWRSLPDFELSVGDDQFFILPCGITRSCQCPR